MSSTAIDDAVESLRAGVDGLLAAGLAGLSGLQVAGLVEALEVERRRLDAVDARVVAEADLRQVAREFGRTSTADLLAVRCRVDVREAKARVERARSLARRLTVTGEPLEPLLPVTAAAVQAGQISTVHAEVIADVMRRIDRLDCAAEAAGPVETFLVEAARHEDPRALRRTGQLVVLRLDPDGTRPDEEAEARRRGLTITRRPDGSIVITGRLTAECAAVWQPIIDTLSAPMPAEDGTVDDRLPAQRRHDGFDEAGRRLLRSGTLPDSGGTPVTVLVRTTAEDLAADTADTNGVAQTGHGDLISMATVRRLADEAELVLIAVAADGAVLNYGRSRRLATPAQRRALAARDGGCCFPGCTRPAAWTQAHHVIAWIDGGLTDIDNLCLVCTHHHRLLDRGDWQVIMTDGLPEWIPPPWLDPARRPIRNRAHHLPEIDFGEWEAQLCPDVGAVTGACPRRGPSPTKRDRQAAGLSSCASMAPDFGGDH